MCDKNHYDEDLSKYTVTRRQFGALVGAGVVMMLPKAVGAVDVTESEVNVQTADGMCDAYFVRPASGTAPGVIMWPDIMGIRPAFRQMGKRLAESGYAVLVVNPFYRQRKGAVIQPGQGFQDPAVRDVLLPLAQALNPATNVTDARAFVSWLDQQPAVARNRRMGAMGYCMSGPFVLRAAGVSDRVGAVASFHGGGLVTDAADSPHLVAARTKAQFLIAIAENDDMRAPNEKNVLKQTFGGAAEVEVYAGAAHGWCPPDSAVYHEAQAERAWTRLMALFQKNLA